MSMQDYARKKAAFEQATAGRTHMIAMLHDVTKAMAQSPELFHFANCAGGFPAEVALNRAAPTFDAHRWPTAQQIQDVLVAWHTAREHAMNAWRALSPEEQRAMQAPT